MPVVAFVRPEPAAPADPPECTGGAEARLRLYGRGMRLCLLGIVAIWSVLQAGCLLSLFAHFRSGIVAGAVDGTIAFRFWPPVDYFSPAHAAAARFAARVYPWRVCVAYSAISLAGSAPFCAALLFLARLFGLYARGEVFARSNADAMRRAGVCVMATGWSPFLLGPLAHAIGVLRPVTGVTGAMIACLLLGLALLAVAHVMEIGRRIQQDQEGIL